MRLLRFGDAVEFFASSQAGVELVTSKKDLLTIIQRRMLMPRLGAENNSLSSTKTLRKTLEASMFLRRF